MWLNSGACGNWKTVLWVVLSSVIPFMMLAANRIVTVDGYIYYPNQKKRVKLKQLEAIIYSMEII